MYKGCIYRHWHINEDGIEMSYVGQHKGENPSEDRWKNGKGYITKKVEYKSTKFADAIIEYGWRNFHHDIIEYIEAETEQELKQKIDEREKYWVAYYDSYNNGYNSTKGGKGGKGNVKGCKFSEEQKRKISESLKGYKHTEETRRKMSEGHKGLKRSEETKRKMRESHAHLTGGKHPFAQKIVCVETKQVFDTVKEAGIWCGLKNGTSISQYLKGKTKSAGKHPITKQPLHWMYFKDYILQLNKNNEDLVMNIA